jgi:hypothetical protein
MVGLIVQNGDSNKKDSDELQETRPDGRIDSSDLNNEGQGEISEQKVTVDKRIYIYLNVRNLKNNVVEFVKNV